MCKRSILGFLLIFASSLLQADTSHSLATIQDRIEQHVLKELEGSNNNIHVSAGKNDSRLKLRTCNPNNLEVFNP